jgi:hypothetical protein
VEAAAVAPGVLTGVKELDPMPGSIIDKYIVWLTEHHRGAVERYEELCRLDDQEQAAGESTEYYTQVQQMFGYVAALEKCLKEAKTPGARTP